MSEPRTPANASAGRYLLVPSRFGAVGLLWQETAGGPRVRRVFLPGERATALELLRQTFADATPGSTEEMDELGRRMEAALAGAAVEFPLAWIALESCRPFQRDVLLAERHIPRGRVTTYSRLAAELGLPAGAARAVGHASARNPFSIIVPCHRVVGAGGELRGYGGGLRMKRALLEMEGVEFSPAGTVVLSKSSC